MRIAGELERVRLAAAIESECILLPSESGCKKIFLTSGSSAGFNAAEKTSGGDS